MQLEDNFLAEDCFEDSNRLEPVAKWMQIQSPMVVVQQKLPRILAIELHRLPDLVEYHKVELHSKLPEDNCLVGHYSEG